MVHPRVLLARIWPEWHVTGKCERGILADIVVHSGIPGFNRAVSYSISDLEGTDGLARSEGLDLEATISQVGNHTAKQLRPSPERIERLREGRLQAPAYFGHGLGGSRSC